ncbi:CsbD family protein [Microlunatus sp. GCM10028923]|uniref:CsbD family protein n=1 Tax=Microlunatus sp. GCM10028923 TaxID=3273400 RepID=UPI00362152C2
MSFADKAREKADEVAGKIKKAAGDAADDPGLEREGRDEEIKAKAKQAGEQLKDAADKARERMNDRH